MAITFQACIEDDLLIITASGRDEHVQEVIDYGISVIDLAVKKSVKRVLCDERNLEYALNTFDTFRVAEAIAARAPRLVRVAIVCGAAFLQDGKFWETVSVNRGLLVRVDTDIVQATEWLAGK